MNIRKAKIRDADGICSLINQYAEQDIMLFRSKADIYENLQSFIVAELDGQILGCCSLQIIWSDLAEIKSLAVDKKKTGSGVGRALVTAAAQQGQELGIARIFALTLTPEFFEKMDFEVIEKDLLPMKVWTDCAKCSKQQNCDEIAMVKSLLPDG